MVGFVPSVSLNRTLSAHHLSIRTSSSARGNNSVQQTAKNISSIAQRCEYLQTLGPENQDEVREYLRQDTELQAFLHILPLEGRKGLKRTISAPALCMHDEVDQSQHIKNATWVFDLLVKDIKEKRPGANERLTQLLSWQQEIMVAPTKNQAELNLKKTLLMKLAACLKEHALSGEHAQFAIDIVENGLSQQEIQQLSSPDRFNKTMRRALGSYYKNEDALWNAFPILHTEILTRKHFRSLSPEVLRLNRNMDRAFEEAREAIRFPLNLDTAKLHFDKGFSYFNGLLTEKDKAVLRQNGIVEDNLIELDKLPAIRADIHTKEKNKLPLTDLEHAVKRLQLKQLYITNILEKEVVNVQETYVKFHRQYDARHNGLYPITDKAGNELIIKGIEKLSIGGQYSSEQVKKFISSKKTELERAALYDDYLECRDITPTDLSQRHPSERDLIGQKGVFAKQDIRKGQCLGVYGGMLRVESENGRVFYDSKHTVGAELDLKERENGFLIQGNNVLSRMNTIFDYDAKGNQRGQALMGYNVEKAPFEIKFRDEDKRNILLHAIFALSDIKAGQELRINYDYSPTVRRALSNR